MDEQNTKNSHENFGAPKSKEAVPTHDETEQDFGRQQELIYQMSMFEQQMQQIQQQMQMVEQGIAELNELNKGLDNLKGKKGKEILAQIGRGIFVKANLISEDLIVDIGGKNFVSKDIEGGKEMIDNQIKKLEDVYEQLTKSLNDLNKEMIGLITRVQGEAEEEK